MVNKFYIRQLWQILIPRAKKERLVIQWLTLIVVLLSSKQAIPSKITPCKMQNNTILQENTLYPGYIGQSWQLTGHEFLAVSAYNAGINPTMAVSGDFNKDGKMDIAIANKEGVLIFLKNEGVFANPLIYNIEGH